LGNITTKTLTQQLRELEEEKIVKRTVYAEVPPKVEYSLTEIGKIISPILKSLCEWGKLYKNMVELDHTTSHFPAKNERQLT
jgi:DNA-binding HxlR family transcriptional regulator